MLKYRSRIWPRSESLRAAYFAESLCAEQAIRQDRLELPRPQFCPLHAAKKACHLRWRKCLLESAMHFSEGLLVLYREHRLLKHPT